MSLHKARPHICYMERHEMIDAADLRTFKQIAAEMPAFTYHRLRYLWDNREKNGTKEFQVFVKINDIRMVVKPNLDAWVTHQLNGRTH
jgi:hypothetical protein